MIWGGGYCHVCQRSHLLPSSKRARSEVSSRLALVRDALDKPLGRMVGVLIAEDHAGREVVLQAYSGTRQLPGLELGWADPTRRVAATETEEAQTFSTLNALSTEIEGLGWPQVVAGLEAAKAGFERAQNELQQQRAQARAERARIREASPEDAQLHEQLRQTSWDESVAYRRRLKEARIPVEEAKLRYDVVLKELQALKQKRQRLSNRLQSAFNDEHELTNFRGVTQSIDGAHLPGVPLAPGSGECSAPKLFQDAVRRGLRPIAMAEAWVGPSHDVPKRVDGEFYGPCEERCLPIMGHLMCGMERAPYLSERIGMPLLLEGPDWVVVAKPGCMLAIPGRGSDKLDSVQSRIRRYYGRGASARVAHRLDHETSGAMLVALDGTAQSQLQAQFVERSTRKQYLAWVEGRVEVSTGSIELPLRRLERGSREQMVDANGKTALTRFRVVGHWEGRSLVLFEPVTGRSHQLRVHAAHGDGLGRAIRGDSLYGQGEAHLYLHAWTLAFEDPSTGSSIQVCCPIPDYWPDVTMDLLAAADGVMDHPG